MRQSNALLFALRNTFEHNPAVVYKAVYMGETASIIEKAGWQVKCFDVDVDQLSLTTLIEEFSKKPEVIFIWSEVHQARMAKQLALTAKKVHPDIKIFVFGRATVFIPQYFERFPFDAVHVSGDREASIADYLYQIDNQKSVASGVSMRDKYSEVFTRSSGRRLDPDEWPLPVIKRLPVEKYRLFSHRTHGQNYSDRLALTVSKGCELACAYCGATREEGFNDRRRDVGTIIDWAEKSHFDQYGSLLHLFASNLFANHAWIKEFCRQYEFRKQKFKWRGVTTVTSLLDKDIVYSAGANGCVEVAVGVETLFSDRDRTAKSSVSDLNLAVENAKQAGITLKGLVMLGYPGQRDSDITELERLAENWEIELRYTGYTPLHRLGRLTATDLDLLDIESYDRRTYFDCNESKLSRDFFYKKISQNGGYFKPIRRPTNLITVEQGAEFTPVLQEI